MNIILDLRSIVRPESGDGQFAVNILRSLAALDLVNKYILLARPQMLEYFNFKNTNFKTMNLSIKPYSVSEQLLLPGIIRKSGIDLFHSFTYSMPYWIGCPSIVTVYDMIHWHFKQNYPWKLRLYYQLVVRRCVKKASRIVTISRHSKDDIVKSLGVDKGRIEVVYCGCSEHFKPMDKAVVEAILKKSFNLNPGFILYVGNMRPHKNVGALIDAFRLCLEKKPDLILVICGKKNFSYAQIQQKVRDLSLNEKVRFMDDISEQELPWLYNAAGVLVFPSLYEGFGLPPLEAMACATPVISSDTASLPEILGDAARFINPKDTQSISEAIMEVLSQKDKADELRKKGLERSRSFSWEKSAQDLLNLYKSI